MFYPAVDYLVIILLLAFLMVTLFACIFCLRHEYIREGANKQVISSQVDSLIKISRIWANFFPANTSNQPI
ncbi:hypothetical protein D6W97_00645 [Shigella sonnei]|nr:hypothetical protein [Shigella sonnei]EFX8995225.1 hypothetical protein [Shigella sonnei]EFX9261592.1 hypothetical protein [Shigella sonnei]